MYTEILKGNITQQYKYIKIMHVQTAKENLDNSWLSCTYIRDGNDCAN